MFTQTQLTESNRNDRWAKLHKACQLSAQCHYTRCVWGVGINRDAVWPFAQIDSLIATVRLFRYIDCL